MTASDALLVSRERRAQAALQTSRVVAMPSGVKSADEKR